MSPSSTRRTAVLDLTPSPLVPIHVAGQELPNGSSPPYSFNSISSPDLLNSSPFTWFNSVSIACTGCEGAGSEGVIIFRVSFWVEEESSPKYATHVAAPFGWTPRLYGAALNLSIRKYKVVVCYSKHLFGCTRTLLNTVNSMFCCSTCAVIHYLRSENAFRYVRGGGKSVLPKCH